MAKVDMLGRGELYAFSGVLRFSGALCLRPSPPSLESTIRKTGKFHFQSPKIPSFNPCPAVGPI